MTETVPTRTDAAALPEIVRAYLESWNGHDGAAVARTMAYDGTYVDPILPAPLPPDALAGYVEATVAAFPDLRFAIEGVVALGDRLTMQWPMIGTHAGPLPGSPSPPAGGVTSRGST